VKISGPFGSGKRIQEKTAWPAVAFCRALRPPGVPLVSGTPGECSFAADGVEALHMRKRRERSVSQNRTTECASEIILPLLGLWGVSGVGVV